MLRGAYTVASSPPLMVVFAVDHDIFCPACSYCSNCTCEFFVCQHGVIHTGRFCFCSSISYPPVPRPRPPPPPFFFPFVFPYFLCVRHSGQSSWALQMYAEWISAGKLVLDAETHVENLDFCDNPEFAGIDIIVKVMLRVILRLG